MELNDAIILRKSIRVYKDTAVAREDLEQLIAAAQQAPSWKNSQTVRFYIVSSNEMLEKFKKTCLPQMNAARCANASAIIVTAFEKGVSGFSDGEPDNDMGDHWGAFDLGLATENILLKATELGLATLVMGIRDSRAIRELLNIPDSQQIAAVLAVGYAGTDPEKPARKDPEEIAAWF